MLEICVSLRRGSSKEGSVASWETDIKKAGDIIVAKKQPCVWGKEERRLSLITYLVDDKLESSMDGDIVAFPYAVTKSIQREDGEMESIVVNRSKYRVDLSMFSGTDGLDASIICSETTEPTGKKYLEIKDLILDESDRTAG